MCYFCECVKPQKKKAAERYYSRRPPRSKQWMLSCGFSAGPNETGISEPGHLEEEEIKGAHGEKGPVPDYPPAHTLLQTLFRATAASTIRREGRS